MKDSWQDRRLALDAAYLRNHPVQDKPVRVSDGVTFRS